MDNFPGNGIHVRHLLAAAVLALGSLVAIGPVRAQGSGSFTAQSPAAQSPAAQSPAPHWPQTSVVNGASVTVYQPQAISWPDHKTLTARAAVAITPAQAKQPIIGTIEVSLATTTDTASRSVMLSDPQLLNSHFPALDTQQASQLDQRIRTALPQMQTRSVPLDAVLLSLKELPEPSVAVNNDPPVIFHSERPASFLVFDGDPVLAPVGKTELQVAVNTNWDVFKDHRHLVPA